MKSPFLIVSALLMMIRLTAGQSVETWVTSKGAMFEASVQKVVPGSVVFVLKDGREQAVPITDLSERSRSKVVELLGFGSTPVTPAPAVTTAAPAAAPTAMPVPAPAPAPASVMQVQPVDGAAVDLTDAAMVESLVGKDAVVVGTVAKVITLGASGHRLVEFEGSNFNLFISKQQIEQSADWVLDDLPGKRLQVKGKVETYRDAPQIRGTDPAQITRVQ
jgi:hypothetical protein